MTDFAKTSFEAALETGEVFVVDDRRPLALPTDADQAFLREQELHRGKEIVFDSAADRVTGYRFRSAEQNRRLHDILHESQREAALWLGETLSHYAAAAKPLRTCFHIAEEATRCLRVTARYDLLHIDALHHSAGQRILRVFANLNPVDPRVWASSDTLAKILPQFGPKSGLLGISQNRWPKRLGQEMLRLFRADRDPITSYDEFMLAFARYLKHSDEFQEKSPRKIWRFLPGQAWAAFTDSLVHADLRGRWVLDHLFLIPPDACVRPELAPAALLEKLMANRGTAAA